MGFFGKLLLGNGTLKPGLRAALERIGLGIREERVAVYCRSGRAKLMDAPFSDLVGQLQSRLERAG